MNPPFASLPDSLPHVKRIARDWSPADAAAVALPDGNANAVRVVLIDGKPAVKGGRIHIVAPWLLGGTLA